MAILSKIKNIFSGHSKSQRNMRKQAEKALAELSPTAQKYGFRISCPNGYFPEDADNLIMKLESEISNLSKENTRLSKELAQLQKDHSTLRAEYQRMQISTTLQEIPDVSVEEGLSMISQMSGISHTFSDAIPALKEEYLQRRSKNSKQSEEVISHVAEVEKTEDDIPKTSKKQQQVFNDLISPRKKKNGGN